jgi:hypothetical protein
VALRGRTPDEPAVSDVHDDEAIAIEVTQRGKPLTSDPS